MRTAWLGLAVLLLAPTAQGAEPCPACGDGCVPELYVDQTRDPGQPVFWPCPAGCIPLERVASLRDEPGCTYVPTPPSTITPADGTASRTVFLPTASASPTGQVAMTGYAAGLWQIEYAVNENVHIGSMIFLPIYIVGAIPNIKLQFQPTDHLQLGGGAFAGMGGPYVEGGRGNILALYGGHLELSVPVGNHTFTLGAIAGSGAGRKSGGSFKAEDEIWIFPNLSWRWAFHPAWLALVELSTVFAFDGDGRRFDETVFILLYGVRGHGDILFGDIGFALPLFHEYITEVWKYTPIGIPYFSIGLKF